ncbi:hypothetical protein FB382_000758 [Nocardioides ginsengisegetis]|uniref:Uncharacterized protein n=1 Tax=Nocardioides ginsengisegetis TaxID=661491 RepID=A0A7W3P8I4_9ACTN|nr:hypothetical protein [Nocardioides ginsengisegetis]
MTWHTATVPPTDLAAALASIQRVHGTVISSRPEPDGIHLTWTTSSASGGNLR